MEKKLRTTEDERDKVFEELQTAEEKLLSAEETATKVSDCLKCMSFFNSFLLSVFPLSCPLRLCSKRALAPPRALTPLPSSC